MSGDSPGAAGPVLTSGVAQRGRPRVRWMVPVAVLLVLAVGALGFRWLTHARAFQDFGNEIGATVAPGDTWYFDMAVLPRSGTARAETIDITDIKPRVTTNTADATISVVVCTHRGLERVGAVRDDIGDYCAALVPWSSGPLAMGADADSYLLLAITPRHQGQVKVDGADVSFRLGIRQGTQHTGISTVVETP